MAREQVWDGRCERCGTAIIKKEMEQWKFRITRYADELLEGLERIDWPERVKVMQTNWIGRSYGAEVLFHSEEGDELEICLKGDKEMLPALDANLTLGFDPETAFVFRKDTGERLL